MRKSVLLLTYFHFNYLPSYYTQHQILADILRVLPIMYVRSYYSWTSLVVQWIGIHLPMQGTRVWSLVQEDSTCHGAAEPVHHNYWAHALEPACRTNWSPCAWSLYSITREVTPVRSLSTAKKSSPLSLQLEKACAGQWGPSAVKTKQNKTTGC